MTTGSNVTNLEEDLVPFERALEAGAAPTRGERSGPVICRCEPWKGTETGRPA